MRKFSFPARTIPFAFLLLCLVAYGLFIPWLGFFWDDWPYSWFAQTLGPMGLVKALANDRPFLAGIYMITTTLLGLHPIAWQVFALLGRWLSVLAFWWTLRQVWPGAARPAAWAALLFAVYPGFQQHWISVIYSQAYLMLSATILSLGLMVYSLRTARRRLYWPLTIAALLLSAFSLFSTEYFAGLELIRPVLLWFALQEVAPAPRQRLRPVILGWLPYMIELAFFGLWRTFLFHAETYQVAQLGALESNPLSTLLSLFRSMFADSFTAGLVSWGQIFQAPNAFDLTIRTTQLYWLVIAASLGLLVFYLWKLRYHQPAAASSEDEQAGSSWSHQALFTAVLALFASMLPFWAAGLPFNLNFPYDRFTLAMMFGSALLVAALIEFFIRTHRQKIILLSILVALAVGFQFQAANTFRRDFSNMRSFFWQLTWRAPDLQPNTMLLAYELPFAYYSDNSLSAPLNWIYAPENRSQEMPYILLYLRTRLKNTLPGLKPDLPANINYRALTFRGNTSQAVVIHTTPSGCLRVLDPVYTNSTSFPKANGTLLSAIPLSNLAQILPSDNPPLMASELFGTENRRSWCYYFEKADLARQQGDWQQVVSLYNEANKKRLETKELSEWMPFIEGFARTSDWTKAQRMNDIVARNRTDLQPGLCQLWQRLQVDGHPDSSAQAIMQKVLTEMKCTQL